MVSMAFSDILLFETENDQRLKEELIHAGIFPHSCESIVDALQILRQGSVSWILLDSRDDEVDVLEVVLNVRDIDDEVCIAVMGPREDPVRSDRVLENDPNIYFINRSREERRVTPAFLQLLDRESPAGNN
jgi:PleD family two-component response regulator